MDHAPSLNPEPASQSLSRLLAGEQFEQAVIDVILADMMVSY
jgi:hypothetical protein